MCCFYNCYIENGEYTVLKVWKGMILHKIYTRFILVGSLSTVRVQLQTHSVNFRICVCVCTMCKVIFCVYL